MPKVIDLPTSTSISDSDYLVMESSSGGTKKITRNNVMSGIGDTVRINSALSSIADNTETDLCSITLTKGIWIIVGQFRMASGALNYQASISISTTSGSSTTTWGGYDQFPVTSNMGNLSVTTTRILNVTATSQTVYLVGWQNSGAARSITQGGTNLYAVRVR